MKNKPLQILLGLVLVLVLAGCAGTVHDTTIHASSSGSNQITGGVTTGIGDHTTVGVQGDYNLDTGNYNAGVIVTFKQPPSEACVQALDRAQGYEASDTIWILPNSDFKDVNDPVFLALRAAGNEPGGADVVAFARPGSRGVTPLWGANKERTSILAHIRRERARLINAGAAQSVIDHCDELIAWLLDRDERYNSAPGGLGAARGDSRPTITSITVLRAGK